MTRCGRHRSAEDAKAGPTPRRYSGGSITSVAIVSVLVSGICGDEDTAWYVTSHSTRTRRPRALFAPAYARCRLLSPPELEKQRWLDVSAARVSVVPCPPVPLLYVMSELILFWLQVAEIGGGSCESDVTAVVVRGCSPAPMNSEAARSPIPRRHNGQLISRDGDEL